MAKKKKPIGYFKNNRGNLVSILKKDGESKEDAIKRVTAKHGYKGRIHSSPSDAVL